MKQLLTLTVLIFISTGCMTWLAVEDPPVDITRNILYEMPYQRYIRHHPNFSGYPGICKYCNEETVDHRIRICEDCYYRVFRIPREKIRVEPIQKPEPMPRKTNYSLYAYY